MIDDKHRDFSSLALLINGQQVLTSGGTVVVSPYDDKTVATVSSASEGDLNHAISAAENAFSDWSTNQELRSQTLLAIAGVIVENQQALATALSIETGLPFSNANDEVGMAAYFFKYRSKSSTVVDILHDDDRQSVQVIRKPIGVVAAIIPWNAPMMIASEKISTAFAAGNVVVLKTSPLAPLSLLLLGKLLTNIVPAGVLNILCGDNNIGEALVADSRVGMVSFTGSTVAGRVIMASAAKTLKRLSLELGGNDPAIVLPDVNVSKVASKLFWGAFYRSGQVCAAIKRLYVHESIYDDMLVALAAVAEKVVPSEPFAEGALMGGLSNRMQFDKLQAIVAASITDGGEVIAGGKAMEGAGCFYPPTLIANVSASNPLVCEEQFGPALPIIKYSDIDEAIQQANDTEYGLGASVWSSDIEAAEIVARQLQAGSVWVNRHGIVMPNVPFGGFKQSGLGRANGDVGLDAYSELQTVSVAKPRKP